MQLKQPNKKPKATLITSVTIAVIAILFGIYASLTNTWPFNGNEQSTSLNTAATPEEEAEINQKNALDKQAFLDNKTDKAGNEAAIEPTINLSAITTDDSLVVQTELNSISAGECTLTLNSGQNTITKNADVIYAPKYSTCAGFSIKKSELHSGNWTLTLLVTAAFDNTYKKSIDYRL